MQYSHLFQWFLIVTPFCRCGQIEDISHFPLNCPLYDLQRSILFYSISDSQWHLYTFLANSSVWHCWFRLWQIKLFLHLYTTSLTPPQNGLNLKRFLRLNQNCVLSRLWSRIFCECLVISQPTLLGLLLLFS